MEDKYSSIVRAVQQVEEVVDEYGELLKIAPIAKQVIGAYRWAKTVRIRRFILSLDGATGELTDQERARFDRLVNSPEGLHLLADFADAAVRSRSETAIAALALLYADCDHLRYSEEFKAIAVSALESLPDRAIQAFQLLHSNRSDLRTLPDGSGVSLSSRAVEGSAALAAWSVDGGEWVAVVNDLISRGLLARDLHASMRLGDESEKWRCYFGFDEDTNRYIDLLTRAGRYVQPESER